MSEIEEIRVPYKPTDTEVLRGMRLTCGPLYRGGWRVARVVYSVVHGLALGVAFMMVSFFLARLVGEVPGSAGRWVPVFFIALAGGYWRLERKVKGRGATVYRHSQMLDGQEIILTKKGIGFDNKRSRSMTDWRDISKIIETPDMIVATTGFHGVVIPDRMLSEAGDPTKLRTQAIAWHRAAQ